MSKGSAQLTDKTFLEALKNSDSNALENVYREVFPQVAQYILQNNGAINDAQDIFQETILVTLRYLKKPEFELHVQLNTFMVTIARNMWLKRLRKDKKVPIHLDDDMLEGVPDVDVLEAEMVFDQRCTAVMEVLEGMSNECKRLLRGFYFEKRSLQDLAAELGYTEGFVRVKKGRCMAELRKKAENHPDISFE